MHFISTNKLKFVPETKAFIEESFQVSKEILIGHQMCILFVSVFESENLKKKSVFMKDEKMTAAEANFLETELGLLEIPNRTALLV